MQGLVRDEQYTKNPFAGTYEHTNTHARIHLIKFFGENLTFFTPLWIF